MAAAYRGNMARSGNAHGSIARQTASKMKQASGAHSVSRQQHGISGKLMA